MNEIEAKNGYEAEDITEEILNNLFFQDFVFRSPCRNNEYQHESTDIFVCFDDVIMSVQIKKQISEKDPEKWAEKKIKELVKQVTGSLNSLKKGKITDLFNERIGNRKISELNFEYFYGLVIVDQESEPYDVSEYVKEAQEKYKVSIQIMSLKDFYNVCRLFDTAEEFFHYYDIRNEMGGSKKIKIHDERVFAEHFVNNFNKLSCEYAVKEAGSPKSFKSFFKKAQDFYKKKLYGDLNEDYRLSFIVDTLIERMHRTGGTAEEYKKRNSNSNIITGHGAIAHEFAKTGRMTRIMHGKEIFKRLEMCRKDPEAEPSFTIESPSRATAYFYYFPKYQRTPEEIFNLIVLVGAKKIKESHDINTVLCSVIQNNPQLGERYFFVLIKR